MIEIEHSTLNNGNPLRVKGASVTIAGESVLEDTPDRNNPPPINVSKVSKKNLRIQITGIQITNEQGDLGWDDILYLRQLDVFDNDPVLLHLSQNDGTIIGGDSSSNSPIPVTIKDFDATLRSDRTLADTNQYQFVVNLRLEETALIP